MGGCSSSTAHVPSGIAFGQLAAEGDASTTLLGSWYATVLGWSRPMALFVNEATLLPVLVPFSTLAATPTSSLDFRRRDCAHQRPCGEANPDLS
jgi:hypothetical protein